MDVHTIIIIIHCWFFFLLPPPPPTTSLSCPAVHCTPLRERAHTRIIIYPCINLCVIIISRKKLVFVHKKERERKKKKNVTNYRHLFTTRALFYTWIKYITLYSLHILYITVCWRRRRMTDWMSTRRERKKKCNPTNSSYVP